MTTLDENVKHVNGPINVVRLEGNVEGIDKVIYLFMDYHYDVSQQTECENIYAKDIQLYLADSFRKLNDTNKMYDFFLEIHMSELQKVKFGYAYPAPINYKEKYIIEIRKFFNKIFRHEPSENKVFVSDKLKNVRLHYIDIREYFEKYHAASIVKALNIVTYMWTNINFYTNDISEILNTIIDFQKYCLLIVDILNGKYDKSADKISIIPYVNFESKEPREQPTLEEDIRHIIYLLDKILSKYNHPDIHKNLLKHITIIKESISSIIANCDNIINFCNDTINRINEAPYYIKHKQIIFDDLNKYDYGLSTKEIRDIIKKIYDDVAGLHLKFIHTYSKIIDIYFLRRFLDKKYVTNAIVYTGASHSNTYIEILIKDFNFKITHTSYSLISDLDDLNNEATKRTSLELFELFLPPIQSQCSDLTNFPDNFN